MILTPASAMSVFCRLVYRKLPPHPDEWSDGPSATAFFFESDGQTYLVTNWHVATGVDPHTKVEKTMTPPSHIRVNLPVLVDGHPILGIGAWRFEDVPLYDADGRARWFVHPEEREKVDVIAIPFDVPADVGVFPYRAHQPVMPRPFQPATELYVVGFPFGRTSYEGLGIWTRGTVASEPDFPWEGLPRFLIDARTRESQSGSPVHMPIFAGAAPTRNFAAADSPWLVGVYSGRINVQSDLGFVWPTTTLIEIISARHRDDHDWVVYE